MLIYLSIGTNNHVDLKADRVYNCLVSGERPYHPFAEAGKWSSAAEKNAKP